MQEDEKAAVVSCTFYGDFFPGHCKKEPQTISENYEAGSSLPLQKLDPRTPGPQPWITTVRPGSIKQRQKVNSLFLYWVVWRWIVDLFGVPDSLGVPQSPPLG